MVSASQQQRMDTRRAAAEPQPPMNLDAGWRTLTLVVDWVKHAETKAVAVLASCGVLGGVLYALINGTQHRTAALAASAFACMILVLGAGVSTSIALRPRLRARDKPNNPLYYDHVARKYTSDAQAYRSALAEMTRDPDALLSSIAEQIWAISHVARTKYRWANLALILLLLALAALAVTATISILEK